MGEDPRRRREVAAHAPLSEQSRGSGVIFALVTLALILAIGFFYMTSERRSDRQADAITHAADSVDSAARVVGDAAQNAAGQLRNGD